MIEYRYSAELKKCVACGKFELTSTMRCAVCGCDEFTLATVPLSTPRSEHGYSYVVCKACSALFDRSAHADCPECGKTYIPDARELLAPQTPAQREAVAHAERIRAQFTAQERAMAESQLTTSNVYRPLPPWKQRLFALARGLRTWVTKIRGRKDRTP